MKALYNTPVLLICSNVIGSCLVAESTETPAWIHFIQPVARSTLSRKEAWDKPTSPGIGVPLRPPLASVRVMERRGRGERNVGPFSQGTEWIGRGWGLSRREIYPEIHHDIAAQLLKFPPFKTGSLP